MWLIETNIYWQYFVPGWPQFVFFCEYDNFSLILAIMQHVYGSGRPWIISIKRRVYELIPKMVRRVEPSDLTCRVAPDPIMSGTMAPFLPDTQNCGLRMGRECREHLSRHRLLWKPLVSDPAMHHGTCVTHVSWCMSWSLTRGGRENVPGTWTTRNFAYLARRPWHHHA